MVLKIKNISVIAAIIFLFTACERELSFENGGTPGTGGSFSGTAVFTYEGGIGSSCNGAIVSGTYTSGTALVADDSVVLNVNVTTPGTYNISSSTVNGIVFIASGTFDSTSTGLQSITFAGSGTPLNAGNFSYLPGTNGCVFSITVESGTTPPPSSDCKECNYTPICVGSKYTFINVQNIAGSTDTVLNEITQSVDTVISSKNYKKITSVATPNLSGQNSVYYQNCTNGISNLITYNSVTVGGSTINFTKLDMLKANENAGATWLNTIDLAAGSPPAEYHFSLVEKGISRNVLGNAFNDVIKVHLSVGYTIAGTFTEAASTDYYYARGIGLIEAIGYNTLSGDEIFHNSLKSYFIP